MKTFDDGSTATDRRTELHCHIHACHYHILIIYTLRSNSDGSSVFTQRLSNDNATTHTIITMTAVRTQTHYATDRQIRSLQITCHKIKKNTKCKIIC